MPVKLVYFAWVRERIGRTDETVDLPAETATVADLVRWLKWFAPPSTTITSSRTRRSPGPARSRSSRR
jgi:hypothetical protein